MKTKSTLTLFLVAALTTACTAILGVEDVPTVTAGSGTDGGSSADGSASAALNAFAAAYCRRTYECFPADANLIYVSQDECVKLTSAAFVDTTSLPGVIATADFFQGCTTRLNAASCESLSSADGQFVCSVKGTKKTGELCVTDAQCETALCATDSTTCRGCVDPPGLNQPCTKNGQCATGLVCNASGTCVNDVGVNGSCNDSAPCHIGLQCVNGTCTALPSHVGDACQDAVGCDESKGVLCASGQCAPLGATTPGSPCGFTANGYIGCPRVVICGSNGTCPLLPNEGDSCTPVASGGIPCPPTLNCVNGKCGRAVPPSGCN